MNVPSEEEAQSRIARVSNNNNDDADPGARTSRTSIRGGQLRRTMRSGENVDTSTELKSQPDEHHTTKVVVKGTKRRKGDTSSDETTEQQQEEEDEQQQDTTTTTNADDQPSSPSPYHNQMVVSESVASVPTSVTIVQNETSTTTTGGGDPSTDQPKKDVVPEKKGKVNWKKPGDMPRRPLSAYNLFFKHTREELLGEEAVAKYPTSDKRKHRKTHGKIGFKDMASIVSRRWKSLDEESKAGFEEIAASKKKDYEVAMKEYKKRLKSAAKKLNNPNTTTTTTIMDNSMMMTNDTLDQQQTTLAQQLYDQSRGGGGGHLMTRTSNHHHEQQLGNDTAAAVLASLSDTTGGLPFHTTTGHSLLLSPRNNMFFGGSRQQQQQQNRATMLDDRILLDDSSLAATTGRMSSSGMSLESRNRYNSAAGMMSRQHFFGTSATSSMNRMGTSTGTSALDYNNHNNNFLSRSSFLDQPYYRSSNSSGAATAAQFLGNSNRISHVTNQRERFSLPASFGTGGQQQQQQHRSSTFDHMNHQEHLTGGYSGNLFHVASPDATSNSSTRRRGSLGGVQDRLLANFERQQQQQQSQPNDGYLWELYRNHLQEAQTIREELVARMVNQPNVPDVNNPIAYAGGGGGGGGSISRQQQVGGLGQSFHNTEGTSADTTLGGNVLHGLPLTASQQRQMQIMEQRLRRDTGGSPTEMDPPGWDNMNNNQMSGFALMDNSAGGSSSSRQRSLQQSIYLDRQQHHHSQLMSPPDQMGRGGQLQGGSSSTHNNEKVDDNNNDDDDYDFQSRI